MCLLIKSTFSLIHRVVTSTCVFVDQRASVCSQLLIVNEHWCLEGWPCGRFLSGMDAYRSLHFYALLGTQFAPFLMFFSSTWRTALVMINGIDLDKTGLKGWVWSWIENRKSDKCGCNYHEMFLHRFSCCPLLNKGGSIFLLSKEMEIGSKQSGRDSCYCSRWVSCSQIRLAGSVTSFPHKHRRRGLQIRTN